ncbi:MAG: hypothetical protein IIX54_01000, partial [Clostridia bacterium]|nr:hypothetical protein [Clostridia bacterium]
DEILTLSTHSDEFDNARFVVMAKRIITPNEINHSKNATLNPNAKYPQAWYDKNGLSGYKEQNSSSDQDTVSSELSSIIDSSVVSDELSSDELSSTDGSDISSQPDSSTEPTTVCTHAYSDKYENKDEHGHTYICKLCNQTVVENHIFTLERVEPGYYCSPPTCLSPALYFKSCVCGIKGTETFKYGDPLNYHTPVLTIYNSDGQYHWNPCQTSGCTERINLTEHTYDENGMCICTHTASSTE